MLANLNMLFAEKKDRALAGFNVYGYEDAVSIVRAAEDLNEGVALMVNRDAAEHIPLSCIGPLLISLAREACVPVAVHLDHAVELSSIREAIDVGFSSVMFDGSRLEFEENVEKTCQVMEMARKKGVSVEAEIGFVGYSDPVAQPQNIYTEPEDAFVFYERTGVDALAVSIGTVHRMVVQEASIQYDRISGIRERVAVPLVVHGSSGVCDKDLTRLSHAGIRKINLGTCLRLVFGKTLRREMEENPEEFDRIRLFRKPMEQVKEAAKAKMLLLK